MNAIRLIKQDHQKVNQLFDQFDQMDDRRAAWQLAQQIRQELDAHTYMEETAFYPLFQAREGFKDIVDQSIDEHHEMKSLLQEISNLGGKDSFDVLSDKMSELQDCVDHHVDKEESGFLTKIESVMSSEELERLGRQLEMAKRSYFDSVAKAA